MSSTEGIAVAILLLNEVERLMKNKHTGTDLFKQAVSNVTGIPVEQVTAEQRQVTKLASFGSRYGVSGRVYSREKAR